MVYSPKKTLERETGFEPATSTLARSHSTTELLPLSCCTFYNTYLPTTNHGKYPAQSPRNQSGRQAVAFAERYAHNHYSRNTRQTAAPR
jgi:hypothetical protein